jgi:hypothetical protein
VKFRCGPATVSGEDDRKNHWPGCLAGKGRLTGLIHEPGDLSGLSENMMCLRGQGDMRVGCIISPALISSKRGFFYCKNRRDMERAVPKAFFILSSPHSVWICFCRCRWYPPDSNLHRMVIILIGSGSCLLSGSIEPVLLSLCLCGFF